MDMIFKFRESSGLAGNAQVVGETLHQIHRRHGKLTPFEVVDAARSRKSALHRYFQWDNDKAADEYRKEQARYLIACVVTVQTGEDEVQPVRSFVSINHSYEPVEVVMSSTVMRQQAIQDVQAAIRSLKEKLSAFEEFSDVLAALEKVEQMASRHLKRRKGARATA